MQCPKCGNENPDNAWICGPCRHVLRDNVTFESRISRLAVLSLVLGICSLFLFVLAGIPAIVIGIASIVKIGRSGGMLRGKRIALAGILISVLLMGTFFFLWSRDAPPIANDYTVADLRSAPADCAESFEILRTLVDEEYDLSGAPAVGLIEQDLDMSAEIRGIVQDGNAAEISETLDLYAGDIERAWANMKGTRDVIERLDAFPEVADLTEHDVNDFKIMHVQNLIDMARFYHVYAHLKIKQRDVEAFVAKLIEFDSVCRKLSVNARMMVPKLACLICIRENILTANTIVNDSQTSASAAELLAKRFVPLTDDQLSFRNPMLFEYLVFKSAFSAEVASGTGGKIPLFKVNSTLRFHRNCCDERLNRTHPSGGIASERLSVWPDFYPFDDPDPGQDRALLSFVYRCYNPHGSQVMRMGDFSRRGDRERIANIRSICVLADLLQIVLNKRLGRQASLKARAYSDEYIVDVEDGKVLSPGPDGKVGTRDDVVLRINPEVLGW